MGKRRGILVQWTDHDGKRRSATAQNKTEAKALRASMHRKVFRAKHGIIDPNEAAYAEAGKRPLDEHLDDWKASMINKGDTQDHAARYRRIAAEVLIDGCSVTRLGELDCLAAQRWISSQLGIKWKSGTCNHAVQALRSFGRWLDQYDRSPVNPFKRLKKLRITDDEPQGALELDEIRAVIEKAETGSISFGISGADRAMLYRVGLGTGFRSGSLRKLTPECFVLDAADPYVLLAALSNKSRKRKQQLIQPELAAILKPYLLGKPAGNPALPMPHPCSVVRMWRKDLAAANVPEKNAAGESRKFHGLRHTYITICEQTGSLKTAQALAGHSSPTTTARYAHPGILAQTRAIANLPIVKRSAALALQAGGNVSHNGSKSGQIVRFGTETKKPESSRDFAKNQADFVMGRAGIEPATHGFSVHCSTN